MSFSLVWLIAAVGFLPLDNATASALREWGFAAGRIVLAHIGWGFGIVIPAMLGFYAIVTGGQLLGAPSEPATRRRLGTVAQLMFVGLVPALALIIVACWREPSLVGALFVVLPAYALALFLAVELGGFVFDRETRLTAARATREWARNRIKALSRRSRRKPLRVVFANVAVATVLGTSASLAVAATSRLVVWVILHFVVAIALSLAAFGAVSITHTARDRTTVVFAWLLIVGFHIIVIASAAQLWVGDPALRGDAVGLLAISLFVTLSTFWPRSWRVRILLDLSIRGGAARAAVRSATRRLVKSVAEIATLTPPAEESTAMIARLRRIFRPRRLT